MRSVTVFVTSKSRRTRWALKERTTRVRVTQLRCRETDKRIAPTWARDDGSKSHPNVTQIERKRNPPTQEDNLVPLARTLLLKLEIIDGPSALGLGEISQESIVVCIIRCLFKDDLGIVLVEGEDDILLLLPKLESLERFNALGIDADSGGLFINGEENDKEIYGKLGTCHC